MRRDCITKVTLRHIFREMCSLLKEARKTASFPVMERIDKLTEYIDKVVEPNMLTGGCDGFPKR